jgi:hypothetical protein
MQTAKYFLRKIFVETLPELLYNYSGKTPMRESNITGTSSSMV